MNSGELKVWFTRNACQGRGGRLIPRTRNARGRGDADQSSDEHDDDDEEEVDRQEDGADHTQEVDSAGDVFEDVGEVVGVGGIDAITGDEEEGVIWPVQSRTARMDQTICLALRAVSMASA